MKTTTTLPASWARALTALSAFAIAALLSACSHLNPPDQKPQPEPAVVEKKPVPEPVKPPPPSRLYEWYGSNSYITRIEVSIDEQKARFYSDDRQVGWTRVASGVYRYPTPVGSFAVLEKVKNKKSNLYGKIYDKDGKLVKRNAKLGVDSIPDGGSFKGAPMPYFLRLTNDGIGMHAGPIPRPGNRASHGCIRMPKKFAPILYNYVGVATPVTIKGKGPSYASYLAKQHKRQRAKTELGPAVTAGQPATPAREPTSVSSAPENRGTGQPGTASDMTAATEVYAASSASPSVPVMAEVTPKETGESLVLPHDSDLTITPPDALGPVPAPISNASADLDGALPSSASDGLQSPTPSATPLTPKAPQPPLAPVGGSAGTAPAPDMEQQPASTEATSLPSTTEAPPVQG